jgi:hypothetical protein
LFQSQLPAETGSVPSFAGEHQATFYRQAIKYGFKLTDINTDLSKASTFIASFVMDMALARTQMKGSETWRFKPIIELMTVHLKLQKLRYQHHKRYLYAASGLSGKWCWRKLFQREMFGGDKENNKLHKAIFKNAFGVVLKSYNKLVNKDDRLLPNTKVTYHQMLAALNNYRRLNKF